MFSRFQGEFFLAREKVKFSRNAHHGIYIAIFRPRKTYVRRTCFGHRRVPPASYPVTACELTGTWDNGTSAGRNFSQAPLAGPASLIDRPNLNFRVHNICDNAIQEELKLHISIILNVFYNK